MRTQRRIRPRSSLRSPRHYTRPRLVPPPAAIRGAEVALIVGGLTSAGVGWRTDRPRLQGAGLALALEASMTLGFDVVAARRAHRYRDALAQTSVSAWIDPASGNASATILYAGRF